jgi:hypothetical protein
MLSAGMGGALYPGGRVEGHNAFAWSGVNVIFGANLSLAA